MRFFSFVKIGFICVLFFLFACSKHSSTVPTFSVDVQQRDSIEHFFSGYDYVMLETNENTLLGNVERMKVDSSVIAVQDKGRILLFQHDGKFITKIDKLGRGAGEYLSPYKKNQAPEDEHGHQRNLELPNDHAIQ